MAAIPHLHRHPRRHANRPCFARNTISCIGASIGVTTGTVSIVPATDASSSAAAMNTAAPPTCQWARSPVLRKNTGITTNSAWPRSASICFWSNQFESGLAPARKAPTR